MIVKRELFGDKDLVLGGLTGLTGGAILGKEITCLIRCI